MEVIEALQRENKPHVYNEVMKENIMFHNILSRVQNERN